VLCCVVEPLPSTTPTPTPAPAPTAAATTATVAQVPPPKLPAAYVTLVDELLAQTLREPPE
jgi:hypothetical protein